MTYEIKRPKNVIFPEKTDLQEKRFSRAVNYSRKLRYQTFTRT